MEFLNTDKPPIEDLPDFLEFQLPRQWAPIYSDLPLARVKKQASPYLQFTFLGPKIFVNTTMVRSHIFLIKFYIP